MYFNLVKSDNGIIYSLDNVRLKVDFGGKIEHFVKVVEHLQAYDLRYEVRYWHSNNPFGYVHQWTFSDASDDTVSWTVLACFGNSKNREGVVDFNPNKVGASPLFQEFFGTLRLHTCTRDVVRYDLAIDVPVPRSECRLVRSGKRTYQYYIKDDGLTEYLGTRSHHGFVKLYDKTRESGLDYPLTRLELTVEGKNDPEGIFPRVTWRDPQMSLLMDDDLSNTDRVLVELLRDVPDPQQYLQNLSRRKRKKVEPYLADKVLPLDKTSALRVKEQAFSYE